MRRKVIKAVVNPREVAEHLASEFVRGFGEEIEAIVLFGSVARGHEGQESDIDVLVVSRSGKKELYDALSRVRTKIDLDNDTLTTLVYMGREEFNKYVKSGSPFIEDVLKDGVVLHDSGFLKGIRGSVLGKG